MRKETRPKVHGFCICGKISQSYNHSLISITEAKKALNEYLYVCVCIYMHIHIYTYTYIFIYMHINGMCIYVCSYVYVCAVCACMLTCVYKCTYICVRICRGLKLTSDVFLICFPLYISR